MINGQQGTVNNCEVELGKLAIGEPRKILTFVHRVKQISQPLTEIVLLTTKRTHLQGTLQCEGDFKLIDWAFGAGMGMMSLRSSSSKGTSWNICVGLPEWETQMPVVVFVASQAPVGNCSFTQ